MPHSASTSAAKSPAGPMPTTTGRTRGGAASGSGGWYARSSQTLTRLSRQRRSICFSCSTSTATAYTSCSGARASTARRSTRSDRISPSGTRSSFAAFLRSSRSLSPGLSLS